MQQIEGTAGNHEDRNYDYRQYYVCFHPSVLDVRSCCHGADRDGGGGFRASMGDKDFRQVAFRFIILTLFTFGGLFWLASFPKGVRHWFKDWLAIPSLLSLHFLFWWSLRDTD
jgi:hypothetical protein